MKLNVFRRFLSVIRTYQVSPRSVIAIPSGEVSRRHHQHIASTHISNAWLYPLVRSVATSPPSMKTQKSEESTRRCWKCGKLVETSNTLDLFFCKCGVVLKPDTSCDYFRLFGMESSYTINTNELTEVYKFLQTRLHPDKFATKSDTEKLFAEGQSKLLNESYKTLKKPLMRGLYLLQLHGRPITEVDGDAIDEDFLKKILDINEDLADVSDGESLKEIRSHVREAMNDLYGQLACAFDRNDTELARSLLMQLKYYSSIEEKIVEKLV